MEFCRGDWGGISRTLHQNIIQSAGGEIVWAVQSQSNWSHHEQKPEVKLRNALKHVITFKLILALL